MCPGRDLPRHAHPDRSVGAAEQPHLPALQAHRPDHDRDVHASGGIARVGKCRGTGQYETFIANGRVLAVGQAYNEPHSEIVRDDLERLAAEIAG